jgi:polyhydroxyalkanoate synthase
MADHRSPGAPEKMTPEFTEAIAEIAEKSQRIMREFLEHHSRNGANGLATPFDPLNVTQAFFDFGAQMLADPVRLARAHMGLWQGYFELWQSTARRMMGDAAEPIAAPEPGDRRFRDPAWQENIVFDFIKQSYLLSSRWLMRLANDVDGLDEQTARKVDFFTRQFADALAPTNFALTNPEVLRTTIDTHGRNLLDGLRNLLADLDRGKGRLEIRMTDETAFKLGENVAVTPGKVVYQNDLIQLIQYAPATDTVHRRPLLIIPPWINKYYVLDLRPDNSFVRYAVEQGHTVFMVSWVNPGEELRDKTFEDYMNEGPLAALDAIEKATGEHEVDAIGYCLGGTLLAATLAVMAARKDDRIKSATYFASLIDFRDAGELLVFVDEAQVKNLEQRMSKKGYLEGADMATTFNMLRANDLIWSFVIDNYLLGKDPFPFDLLYWNSDSTRMPAAMHSFYLRKMYIENKLIEPGGLTLGGVPVDLTKIKTPSYVLSTKEDHIAPWRATYAATRTYSGKVRCVLSASGHIAGVINPPSAQKYGYWTNEMNPADPEDWFKGATQYPGSWWTDWVEWVAEYAGEMVPDRVPGDGNLKPIEDAPGSYVRVKAKE